MQSTAETDHRGSDSEISAAGRPAATLVTGSVDWPAWESSSLTTQRSFIDDMASQNQPYRPDW